MNPELTIADNALTSLKAQIAAYQGEVVYSGLQYRLPWAVVAGALADTGAQGNVPLISQGAPGAGFGFLAIDPQGKSWADGMIVLKETPDPTKNTFEKRFSFAFPTAADSAACNALETNLQQVIGGAVYNFGVQFYFGQSMVRVWNRATGAWMQTGATLTSWAPNQWRNLVLKGHRDAGNIYYDALTLDSTDYLLAMADFPIFPAPNLGLPDELSIGLQIDGNQAGQPCRVNVDGIELRVR